MAAWIFIGASFLLVVMLIIPVILVEKGGYTQRISESQTTKIQLSDAPPIIPVFISKDHQVEKIPLEQYVRGVVAAEMPVEFELEALKAQAIASRTFIIRRWMDGAPDNIPVKGALVTDQVSDQAFSSLDQIKKEWGPDFNRNLAKINQAVLETRGLILTYQKKPIMAAFFSTSNGYTENSEDYWSTYIPYLRSVSSPWDKEGSPKYKADVTYSIPYVLDKLGLKQSGKDELQMQIEAWTEGHRIKSIRINNQLFSGREVREKLDLNSSQFSWKIIGGKIDFTTTGYGHGVGMSQWGADMLAKQGKKAADILTYYYTGIKIEQIGNIANRL